jgi:hypothetical protein
MSSPFRRKHKYRLTKSSDEDPRAPKRFKSTGDDFVLRELTLTHDSTLTNDEIHDSIELCPVSKALIDTEVYQRLRNINQLGSSQYIYTCANHNRFQVSLLSTLEVEEDVVRTTLFFATAKHASFRFEGSVIAI